MWTLVQKSSPLIGCAVPPENNRQAQNGDSFGDEMVEVLDESCVPGQGQVARTGGDLSVRDRWHVAEVGIRYEFIWTARKQVSSVREGANQVAPRGHGDCDD